MRCPKCGFISFDHLEACLKCKKDIRAASDALNGGVLHVVPPVFLNLHPEPEESFPEEDDIVADAEDVVDEYVDPDLDILFEDESGGEADEVTLEGGEADEFADLAISMDDGEDDGIAIDLGQDGEVEGHLDEFEDDSEDDGQVLADLQSSDVDESNSEFEIEMPEELIDMSDLAPPVAGEQPGEGSSDALDLDVNLDDFDFELEPDSSAGGESAGITGDGETVLALDDIDFSDTMGRPEKKSGKRAGETDMDEDLNFDLDLGGLSIHDENL